MVVKIILKKLISFSKGDQFNINIKIIKQPNSIIKNATKANYKI